VDEARRAIADSYDRSAPGFADFADRYVYSHLAVPLADALAMVPGPLLDVASGSGALGRLLDDAVATDISHAQLTNNQMVRRVVADVDALPFSDGTFAGCGCAFGINHFPNPSAAVTEMARVGGVVGLSTWQRPDISFAPKEIVLETIAAHSGGAGTTAGELVDEMTEAMGSPAAIGGVLSDAGLEPEVSAVRVEIPWPGTEAFLDYRLSMIGTLADVIDVNAVRAEAARAVNALPDSALRWAPALILGIGRPRDRSIRSRRE
jgi:hypothetical protein